jgi:drug/metabolite transporter (DMT)-like permease
VALASVLIFGERLDRLRWAALVVSLTGVVLVVGGGESLGTVDLLGVGLAAFAGIVQAGYVLIARHGFNAVPGAQAGVLTMSGAVVLLLIIGLLTGQAAAFGQPLASIAAFWPVLLAGTLGAGIPTVAFILGIRLLGASRGAILATLEPVVGVALAALLLGERPGPLQLIGGALIIVAGVLLQLPSGRETADHEAVAEAR